MLTKMVTLAAAALLLTSSLAIAAPRVQAAGDDVTVSQANTPAYWLYPETGHERGVDR